MSEAQLSREEFLRIRGQYDETPVRSHSIDTRCYLDPKFLKIEREQIFHRSWQFLCHEEKLRDPGSYVTLNVESQPVVAMRNPNGELRAFYNVCKHRGHFMVWRFYPVSETETYEEFDFFFETAEPNETEKEALAFIDDVLQVEDINLVESVQRGMSTPAFNSGRYMVDVEGSGLSEHAVHHFHGLVLDAYRRASV